MKKVFNLAALAVSFFAMAACQSELGDTPELGVEEVTATFTVYAPQHIDTKAVTAADQKAVGDGLAADNLVFAVFDEEGNELKALRQGDWKNGIGSAAELTFSNDAQPKAQVEVTLVRGKKYSFVCWAQNKAAECYNFANMKAIGVDYTTYNVGNNDLRDAFYAYAQTNGKVDADFSLTITLKRPFAQINMGTKDFEAATNAGLNVNNLYTTVTVKGVANSLNTFTGEVTGSVDATFAYAHTVAPDYELVIDMNKVVNKPAAQVQDTYGWLAMNYVLVAESSSLVEVGFTLREGDDVVLTSYDVPNVPVQRNHRTNIVGDLLTAEGEINILIDPVFPGEYIVE